MNSHFIILTLAVLLGAISPLRAQTAPPEANPATNAVTSIVTNVTSEASTNAVAGATNAPDATTTNEVTWENHEPHRHHYHHRGDNVRVGTDLVVPVGETKGDVVMVSGNATIDGTVEGDLVVVSGSATVNGTVTGDLVVVLGSAKLGPNAEIKRDAVVVGGKLERAATSKIGGDPVEVNADTIPLFGYAIGWLTKGLFLARPLPHQLGWAWGVAGIFLVIHLLLALMFPRPIQACVTGIENRPLGSFFTGFLSLILLAPAIALLVVSAVGILVIPFLLCGMVVSFLLGKVVVYRYVGQQLGQQLHLRFLQLPLVALIVGTGIFYLLYIIPIIGFLAWGVISVFGLGAVVLTAVSSLRRENERDNPGRLAGATAPLDPGAPLMASHDASTFPRAGFWIRVAAVLLDLPLFLVLGAVTHKAPIVIIAWFAYYVGMWAWKGATIGGIVTGIKIVREDGRPIEFAVALVRFLAASISMAVLLIGFFWAGWSKQKRSWHDIIAGTIVVKVPKGLSLL